MNTLSATDTTSSEESTAAISSAAEGASAHPVARKAEPWWSKALLPASFLTTAWALYYVFLVVPNEVQMGAVQRIFYFHVASAFACYIAFFVVLGAAIWYLATHSTKADHLMEASGEVGFVFCTICLGSGMIWGYVAWNTPFQLEPRLVSTLLLWLIFLSFTVLRAFGDPQKVRSHSAVLGILGAVTVPIVVYSIELLPQFQQLHPRVVDQGGLKSPLFKWGLLYATIALLFTESLFIALRYRIGQLTHLAHEQGID
jgi:heme exporter protein C